MLNILPPCMSYINHAKYYSLFMALKAIFRTFGIDVNAYETATPNANIAICGRYFKDIPLLLRTKNDKKDTFLSL